MYDIIHQAKLGQSPEFIEHARPADEAVLAAVLLNSANTGDSSKSRKSVGPGRCPLNSQRGTAERSLGIGDDRRWN